MNRYDALPAHAKLAAHILGDVVGEGKRDVAGTYLPWCKWTENEQQEVIGFLKVWQSEGYLTIIGDFDTWKPEAVCYSMNNFIYASELLPDNWLPATHA